MLIASATPHSGADPMQYVFKTTKKMASVLMSFVSRCAKRTKK
jgi:hypothetical protein